MKSAINLAQFNIFKKSTFISVAIVMLIGIIGLMISSENLNTDSLKGMFTPVDPAGTSISSGISAYIAEDSPSSDIIVPNEYAYLAKYDFSAIKELHTVNSVEFQISRALASEVESIKIEYKVPTLGKISKEQDVSADGIIKFSELGLKVPKKDQSSIKVYAKVKNDLIGSQLEINLNNAIASSASGSKKAVKISEEFISKQMHVQNARLTAYMRGHMNNSRIRADEDPIAYVQLETQNNQSAEKIASAKNITIHFKADRVYADSDAEFNTREGQMASFLEGTLLNASTATLITQAEIQFLDTQNAYVTFEIPESVVFESERPKTFVIQINSNDLIGANAAKLRTYMNLGKIRSGEIIPGDIVWNDGISELYWLGTGSSTEHTFDDTEEATYLEYASL